MRRSLFDGAPAVAALMLAVLFTTGGCKRGDEDASAADRDARRGGVSRAPLPPRTRPADPTTGPAAGGPIMSPGPATAPAGAEMPGGVRGHMFAGFENAKSVVFVCDGTGTMVKRFGVLRAEVGEALARLKPQQSFNVVIFFDGPKATAVNSDMLLPATDANKRLAREFLENFSPEGQTDPRPALRLALGLKPEVLFYATDGESNSLFTSEDVADAIVKANPGSRTRLNTVLFGYYDRQAEEVLKQMSDRHGGTHRTITLEDIEK